MSSTNPVNDKLNSPKKVFNIVPLRTHKQLPDQQFSTDFSTHGSHTSPRPHSTHNGLKSPKLKFPSNKSTTSKTTPSMLTVDGETYDLPKAVDFIIALKRELSAKNLKIDELTNEANKLKNKLKEKDAEIEKLRREVDKIKSVLDLTFHKENANKDFNDLSPRSNESPDRLSSSRAKKQGVSGESGNDAPAELQYHEKDPKTRLAIREAILQNDLLNHLELSQVKEMVHCMYEKKIPAGCFIIREGGVGQHLYVSAEGQMEVQKDNRVIGTMQPWRSFGELALLYNCNRTASVRALSDAKLWVLDRRVFQTIMRKSGLERHEEHMRFLRSVPLLQPLPQEKIAKIANALEVETFLPDQHIIHEGETGDAFFIIKSGTVKVTQLIQGNPTPQDIRTLSKGDYFGEKALLGEEHRTASIIATSQVEVLTLDRNSFIQLIGDLGELKEKDYGDVNRGAQRKQSELRPASAVFPDKYSNINLSDLEIVATLGVGGFGRVELVTWTLEKSKVFALKCLKKKHIVDTKQQEHIHWEKKILLQSNCPFICRLYKTFRDDRQVYMLIEACLGGEVWTILRNRGQFDDNITRFIVASVLEAFNYLHGRGVIYRDLKPENLLLDAIGYVKLCDFGFAKTIGLGEKTWTFCGTPEYVAPEVILNKGHDFAADYWSLGILMFELLTGSPPFIASDPMKIYNIILRGVDCLQFPKCVSKNAHQLIKKLCKENPSERLGYGKGGIAEIKRNKYLQGFDWGALQSRSLAPPIVPSLKSLTDTSNFDTYNFDTDVPPVENSGWDVDF